MHRSLDPQLVLQRHFTLYIFEQKGDERILGDGEFVEKVLGLAKEAFERKYRLKVKGIHIDRIAARVAEIVGIDLAEVWAAGKQHKVVQARSLSLSQLDRFGIEAALKRQATK